MKGAGWRGEGRGEGREGELTLATPTHIQHKPDDDEVTNTKAGSRLHSQQTAASTPAPGGEWRHSNAGGAATVASGETGGDRGRGRGVPMHHTSQWIIDGDELPRADIEVR